MLNILTCHIQYSRDHIWLPVTICHFTNICPRIFLLHLVDDQPPLLADRGPAPECPHSLHLHLLKVPANVSFSFTEEGGCLAFEDCLIFKRVRYEYEQASIWISLSAYMWHSRQQCGVSSPQYSWPRRCSHPGHHGLLCWAPALSHLCWSPAWHWIWLKYPLDKGLGTTAPRALGGLLPANTVLNIRFNPISYNLFQYCGTPSSKTLDLRAKWRKNIPKSEIAISIENPAKIQRKFWAYILKWPAKINRGR